MKKPRVHPRHRQVRHKRRPRLTCGRCGRAGNRGATNARALGWNVEYITVGKGRKLSDVTCPACKAA